MSTTSLGSRRGNSRGARSNLQHDSRPAILSSVSSTKRGFSTAEAAVYVGKSVSWLRKKRLKGIDDPGDPGPRFIKTPAGPAIYLREDLDHYLDELERRFASAARATP
jgi:hypothetical protein